MRGMNAGDNDVFGCLVTTLDTSGLSYLPISLSSLSVSIRQDDGENTVAIKGVLMTLSTLCITQQYSTS